MKVLKIGGALVSILFFSNIWAQNDPQAARDACSDKEQSDACDYTDENGQTLNGICDYNAKLDLYCKTLN